MTTLTVATYNVYLGADLALLFAAASLDELSERAAVVRRQLDATDFAQRARAIARILAREQVDLVGLQEVTRWGSATVSDDGEVGEAETIVDFLPLLEEACTATGTPYDVHAVNTNFGGGLPVGDRWLSIAGANVVLVRRGGPVRVVGEQTGPFERVLAMRTGIDDVSFPITRSWGAVEVEVDGRALVFANTHTEAYDAATRDAQRDELVARLADRVEPVVVVGDFNCRPDDVGMPSPYLDAWTSTEGGRGDAPGHTCGQGPTLDNEESSLDERIDYVFVRGAAVRTCSVVGDQPEDRTVPGRLWPSDHAGVVARLQF